MQFSSFFPLFIFLLELPIMTNKPIFTPIRSTTNIFVDVGKRFTLACSVNNLGNDSISWIRTSRGRGIHTIADGNKTKSSIKGLTLKYFNHTNPNGVTTTKSILEYANVTLYHNGKYTCMVHFGEREIVHLDYQVTVITPKTRIIGMEQENTTYLVQEKASLNVTCEITTATEEVLFRHPIWTFERMFPGNWDDMMPSGIYSPPTSTTIIFKTINLLNLRVEDSGKYTCRYNKLISSYVSILVIPTNPNSILDEINGAFTITNANLGREWEFRETLSKFISVQRTILEGMTQFREALISNSTQIDKNPQQGIISNNGGRPAIE